MTILWTAVYVATSYCLQGTLTASGTVPHFGTVAAQGLPFGTQLVLDGTGWPSIDRQTFVVEDRGGAIGPGRIDVWLPRCADAWQFGRRPLLVSVLGALPQTVEEEPEGVSSGLSKDTPL